MSLKINIPYADKDKAKNLGAFWVPHDRSWTIPDHITKTSIPSRRGYRFREAASLGNHTYYASQGRIAGNAKRKYL